MKIECEVSNEDQFIDLINTMQKDVRRIDPKDFDLKEDYEAYLDLESDLSLLASYKPLIDAKII